MERNDAEKWLQFATELGEDYYRFLGGCSPDELETQKRLFLLGVQPLLEADNPFAIGLLLETIAANAHRAVALDGIIELLAGR